MKLADSYIRYDYEECTLNLFLRGISVTFLLILLVHSLIKLRLLSMRPVICNVFNLNENEPCVIPYGCLLDFIRSFQVDVGSIDVLITSFCNGDCNCTGSPVDDELSNVFRRIHSLGGLSGIPFDGAKAFIKILEGIPTGGGNCLLLYGPHINVDNKAVGKPFCEAFTFQRYGGCSGAIRVVCSNTENTNYIAPKSPISSSDRQQYFLNQMLRPYSQRLQFASETSLELPKVLFDVQTALINHIVAKGCRHLQDDQSIVIVGGIQYNTPCGKPSYFSPLRVDIVNCVGKLVKIGGAQLKHGF